MASTVQRKERHKPLEEIPAQHPSVSSCRARGSYCPPQGSSQLPGTINEATLRCDDSKSILSTAKTIEAHSDITCYPSQIH